MSHPGWEYAKEYPLWKAITGRRTRRVCLGTKEIAAGSLTYQSRQ